MLRGKCAIFAISTGSNLLQCLQLDPSEQEFIGNSFLRFAYTVRASHQHFSTALNDAILVRSDGII